MRVVIVGAGNVGSYLSRALSKENDKVSLIEQDKELSEEVASEMTDVLVINGDATELNTLRDAKVSRADVLVAATDDDNTNLITCQIAKIEFDIDYTVAKVNESEKEPLFEQFGVDRYITTANAMALPFKNAIASNRLKTLFSYEKENIELNEVEVNQGSPANNKKIMDLELPEKSVITSIIREDDILFPRGDTEFKTNDKVQILMNSSIMEEIEKLFSSD